MTSFRGEVKPPAPCCKLLRHIKDIYRYEKRYFIGKIVISRQVSLALQLDVSVCTCQRVLVDESEIIRNQMGMHNKSEMVMVCRLVRPSQKNIG
jgi:hypothetical protein